MSDLQQRLPGLFAPPQPAASGNASDGSDLDASSGGEEESQEVPKPAEEEAPIGVYFYNEFVAVRTREAVFRELKLKVRRCSVDTVCSRT
jgi:hypothetical protein